MTELWIDRQRTALCAFREAVAIRAEREEEIATGTADRTRDADQEFLRIKETLRETLMNAQAAAQANAVAVREQIESRYQDAKQRAKTDHAAAKQTAIREYSDGKAALQTEFQEARWTIDTVYESDKKVARDQLLDAEKSCKEAVEKLRAQRDVARRHCKRWSFVGPLSPAEEVKIEPAGIPDPWHALQQCLDQAQTELAVLQQLHPRLINGMVPWFVLGGFLLVLATPFVLAAVFGVLDPLYAVYALLGIFVTIIPIGMLLVSRQRAADAAVRRGALASAVGPGDARPGAAAALPAAGTGGVRRQARAQPQAQQGTPGANRREH